MTPDRIVSYLIKQRFIRFKQINQQDPVADDGKNIFKLRAQSYSSPTDGKAVSFVRAVKFCPGCRMIPLGLCKDIVINAFANAVRRPESVAGI